MSFAKKERIFLVLRRKECIDDFTFPLKSAYRNIGCVAPTIRRLRNSMKTSALTPPFFLDHEASDRAQ